MPSIVYRLSIILLIAIALAFSPLCRVFAECQKLDEYCGDPPTATFPACCPSDTNGTDNEQIPLKCKNLDNGIGTCEIDENSDNEDMSGMGH